MASPKVVWQPTDKQNDFLAANEDEVLFGGGAGGGKSDALLVDALGLQHQAPLNPRYRALLIRRTTPELRELVDRSRILYPIAVPGAEYHEQAKEWRFPSGAKLILGYCESNADVYRYQGQEFQWIGIDELGHFLTPYVWDYLSSRLRSTDPRLPCYMRATCNPGPKWIRERFGIGIDGEPSCVEVKAGDRIFRRRFIPSRVDDNPHLRESGYRERLMMLPEVERAALLDGRWDVIDVPGAIYGQEIDAAMDGAPCRVTNVPIDPSLPVHTYWDLGVGDSTSIWFMQRAGIEWRAVDYYECSGEGLPHYRRILTDRDYNYGDHWAPHDIQVRELGSGKSRLETARELGINFRVTPNIGIEDGIHAARMVFPSVWFDAVKCERGIECLRYYRRDYNSKLGEFRATPVHDFASHGADAFRYFAVASGKQQSWGHAPQPKLAIV